YTNICIYLMRATPPAVVQRFEQCRYGDICISAITLAELQAGLHASSADPARIQHTLDRLTELVPALPFDADAAQRYGLLYQAVRDRRRDALDRLIAAHAVACDCTLVTNNVADFKGYPGLRVENWVG